ncbi:MAG: hypothetical protein GC138_08635 [Gammaproteobacteria bacterium]|nr:hypothetical protein [Gammaproteobacteria bacterium]
MRYEENGYAIISVISDTDGDEGKPIVHCFKTTEWEAHAAERVAEELPERLREGLRIVPARISFELDT